MIPDRPVARPPAPHPSQEVDRLGGGRATVWMMAGVLLVAAGVGSAWWLMRSELAARRPETDVSFGPPSEERVRTERRVGFLLQTPIEGDRPGTTPEPPGEDPDRPPERWEWIDRERGIARMPIERAIDLVVERYGEAGPEGER